MKDLLQWAIEELEGRGFDTPRLDAEVLMAHAMRRDRLQLYLGIEEVLDGEVESFYRTLIGRRLAREPVGYITGHKEFMSLDFLVNENVLIPRPETEVLVETVSRLGRAGSRVLELGTGSGAIAVSLARYNPDWRILATDLSMKALQVAQENACRHGVIDRILFLQADLLSALSPSHKFDCVVSNPPYIPESSLASLPVDVRDYEPTLALSGGADGLDVIRLIIEQARMVLVQNGLLAIEIGHDQAEAVKEIAVKVGNYSDYCTVADFSGTTRIFHCKREY